MFPTGASQNDIRVVRCCLYESGTYQDQWRRPIETAMTLDIRERIDTLTRGGQMLGQGILNGVANDIIIPGSIVEKSIGINQGWGEKRLRFLLELQITNRFGGFSHRKVITGWTSHMGVTRTNNTMQEDVVDPNMIMYINTDLTLRDTPIPAVGGNSMTKRTDRISADHVLLGSYDTSSPMGVELSLRPEDVTANIAGGATMMNMGGAQVHNAYSQFITSPVKLSSLSNESPVHYLSKILKSYSEASRMYEGMIEIDGFDDTMMNATGNCRESEISNNIFLDKLRTVSDFMENGYFTYLDLVRMFPELDAKTTIHRYRQHGSMLVTPPVRGDSAKNDGADAVSLTMAKIMNSLPGMMFDSLLSCVGFVFTNDTVGCQDTLTPIHANLFGTIVDNLNIVKQAEVFRTRFLTELAPTLTHHGQVSLTVKIIAHVFGNTELVIDYNHTGEYKFNLPTFCDTLTSHMVTNNANKLGVLSRDVGNILNVIQGNAFLDAGSLGGMADADAQALMGMAAGMGLGGMGQPRPDPFGVSIPHNAPVPVGAETGSFKVELF